MIRVVIVGNGLGAALAGLLLAKVAQVTIVAGGDDRHGLGPVGTTIATRPGFRDVLAGLGLAEDRVLAATGGAWSLGQVFSGWRGAGRGWMLPHGAIGASIGPVPFHQLALRVRAEGGRLALADHAVAAVAAQSGRFAPLASIDHGLSFDTAALADLFAARAAAAGVVRAAAPLAQVDRDTGATRLRLADGSIVTGDLFLDLTGAQALLSRDHGWHDWRHWFPCDRAWIGRVADEAAPFTHGGAGATGWRSSVYAHGVRGDVLFHAAGAPEEPGLPLLAEMPVRAGRCARLWQGDTIAMGAAAAEHAPLYPLALEQLAAAVGRLRSLMPDRAGEPLLAAEYDRRTIAELEGARDFALLHLWLAGRSAAPLPDAAAWKLDQYRSRGRIEMFDDESFSAAEWAMLFDAMGVVPERRDPLADLIPAERLARHLAASREATVAAVRTMPSYAAVLAQLHRPGRAA